MSHIDWNAFKVAADILEKSLRCSFHTGVWFIVILSDGTCLFVGIAQKIMVRTGLYPSKFSTAIDTPYNLRQIQSWNMNGLLAVLNDNADRLILQAC